MNMHLFYIYHTYFTSSITLITNLILIFYIWRKTPQQMKPYSHVLLQTCVSDILMATVSSLVLLEIESSEGNFFIRSGSNLFSPDGYNPCIGIWFYCAVCCWVFWGLLLPIIFRYLHIVRGVTLAPLKTWLFQVCLFIFGALLTSCFSFSFCFHGSSEFNYLLKEINPWNYELSTLDAFRSQKLSSNYLIVYFAMTALASIIINCVLIYCYRKTKAKLKTCTFSKQAMRMHKEFNRRITFQTISPLFGVIVITTNFIAIQLKLASNSGFLLFAIITFQYLSVFNPLITLGTIYRKAIIGSILKTEPSSTVHFQLSRTSYYQ